MRYRVRTSKTHGRYLEEEMISPYFSTNSIAPRASSSGADGGATLLSDGASKDEKSRKPQDFDLSGDCCGLEDTLREKQQSILQLKR